MKDPEDRRSVEKEFGLPAILILGAAALACLLGYLLYAWAYQGTGFPLDDAWIHQVYARNLALYGEWSFRPGTVSGGSTSPLWTFMLSLGYLLGQQPAFLWTFFLGFLGLWACGILGDLLFRKLAKSYRTKVPWVGVFLVLEWHLAWAAASGMETIWMAAIFLLVCLLISGGLRSFVLAGLISGLSVWIRPDGLTMLGPLVFVGWLCSDGLAERVKKIGLALISFLVPFGLYLFFNLQVAGTIWPNTYYAKQAEYAVLTQQSLIARLGELLSLPMIGAGILLLPGFIALVAWVVRKKDWLAAAMLLWWLGYSGLYALRLPVTYQHGRYLIPAMPVYFILGLAGTWVLLNVALRPGRWTARAKKFSQVLLPAVLLVFLFGGARAYAQDVAVINTEMVATAKWVNQNIPAQDKIAVHDIGAIGYYCNNKLVDLAGLISPEVIPFIRDENTLASYLNEKQVDYLITFPGWYPQLVQSAQLVHSSGGRYAPELGGENMAVYRWPGTP